MIGANAVFNLINQEIKQAFALLIDCQQIAKTGFLENLNNIKKTGKFPAFPELNLLSLKQIPEILKIKQPN